MGCDVIRFSCPPFQSAFPPNGQLGQQACYVDSKHLGCALQPGTEIFSAYPYPASGPTIVIPVAALLPHRSGLRIDIRVGAEMSTATLIPQVAAYFISAVCLLFSYAHLGGPPIRLISGTTGICASGHVPVSLSDSTFGIAGPSAT